MSDSWVVLIEYTYSKGEVAYILTSLDPTSPRSMLGDCHGVNGHWRVSVEGFVNCIVDLQKAHISFALVLLATFMEF